MFLILPTTTHSSGARQTSGPEGSEREQRKSITENDVSILCLLCGISLCGGRTGKEMLAAFLMLIDLEAGGTQRWPLKGRPSPAGPGLTTSSQSMCRGPPLIDWGVLAPLCSQHRGLLSRVWAQVINFAGGGGGGGGRGAGRRG